MVLGEHFQLILIGPLHNHQDPIGQLGWFSASTSPAPSTMKSVITTNGCFYVFNFSATGMLCHFEVSHGSFWNNDTFLAGELFEIRSNVIRAVEVQVFRTISMFRQF